MRRAFSICCRIRWCVAGDHRQPLDEGAQHGAHLLLLQRAALGLGPFDQHVAQLAFDVIEPAQWVMGRRRTHQRVDLALEPAVVDAEFATDVLQDEAQQIEQRRL